MSVGNGDSTNTGIQKFQSRFRTFIKEFCENSSVHGLKYIKNSRKLSERLYWFTVVSTSFLGGCWITMLLWNRYSELPTRVVIRDSQASIRNIPFPTITICDEHIHASKAMKLFDSLKYPDNSTRTNTRLYLKQLYGFVEKMTRKNITLLKTIKKIFDINKLRTRDVMKRISTNCEDLLTICRWQKVVYQCKVLFENTLTLRGYCCSLNHRLQDKVLYPKTSGVHMGLSFILNSPEDSDVLMYIEESSDVPGFETPQHLVRGDEVFFGIIPDVIKCGNCLTYSRTQLNCVFPSEIRLKYYNPYTQINCLTECILNRTLALCGCAPYQYHAVADYLICDVNHIPCLSRYYDFIRNYNNNNRGDILSENSEEALNILKTKNVDITCDCPDDCENVINKLSVIQQMTMDATQYDVTGFYKNLVNRTIQSVVHVFYTSETCVIWEKRIIATWLDLMGSMGGVFGVFLGCSFISLVEFGFFIWSRILSHYSPYVTSKIKVSFQWIRNRCPNQFTKRRNECKMELGLKK